jgi:hypothetical protein
MGTSVPWKSRLSHQPKAGELAYEKKNRARQCVDIYTFKFEEGWDVYGLSLGALIQREFLFTMTCEWELPYPTEHFRDRSP